MKKLLFLLIATTVFSIQSATAQEKITPPSFGKAVVYFVRTSSAGSMINFKYFDGEKYLGKFNGRKAFRYECKPGNHLFWVKSENIDYIDAELKAGAIYVIEVKATVGFVKASVKLVTVDASDKKQVKKIKKIFQKKELIDLNKHIVAQDSDEIYQTKESSETKESIQRGLKRIEKKKEKGRKMKKITPDMTYIPQ